MTSFNITNKIAQRLYGNTAKVGEGGVKMTEKLIMFFMADGLPCLARPPRPGPYLDFGFQYALIRYNRSKNLG